MVFSSSQELHNINLMLSIPKLMEDLAQSNIQNLITVLVVLTHSKLIDIIHSHHASTTYWIMLNQDFAIILEIANQIHKDMPYLRFQQNYNH